MGMRITIEQVAKADLFSAMSLDEVKELLSKTGMVIKHFHKNDYIFLAGDAIDYLCVLVDGSVQIIKENAKGDKSIIGNIDSGGSFGENGLAKQGSTSNVSYLATKNCEVLMVPFARMNMNVINNQAISSKFFMSIIAQIAKQNLGLVEKVEILGRKTLRGKIMAYLEKQSRINNSSTVVLPFNRTDLANYLDADRSAMTRELYRMQDEGILEIEKNKFTILGKDE